MKASPSKTSPLKVEREQHGWSQTKLAEMVGVSTTTVRHWEHGQAIPYPYYREKLMVLFGKTPQQLGWLFDTDEQEEEASPTALPLEMTTEASLLTSPVVESAKSLPTHDEKLMPRQRLRPRSLWERGHNAMRRGPTFRAAHRFSRSGLFLVSLALVTTLLISIVVPSFMRPPSPKIQPQQETTYSPPSYTMAIQNPDPSLLNMDQHLQQVFSAVYGQLVNRFALDPATAPRNVLVVLTSDLSSPASLSGTTITLSSDWMKQHPNDVGLLTHELTLLLEHYPSAVPSWFADGLADYARSVYGPADDDWSLPDGVHPQERYSQGGEVAARFLRWLELHTRLDIVDQLHHALQRGQSFSATFHNLTHGTVDKLWNQYQAHPDITPTPQQRYTMATSRKPLYQSSRLQLTTSELIRNAQVPPMSNFAMQADITFLSSSNSGGGGFVFRNDDNTSWGCVLIFPDGSYRLDQGYHSGPVMFSPAIKPGLKQTNRLTIIVEKSSISLYINSQFIMQTNDPHLSSYGNLGVIITVPPAPILRVVQFDHIQIF